MQSGNVIFLEERIESYFMKCEVELEIGILIGKILSSQKFFVLGLFPTPVQEEEEGRESSTSKAKLTWEKIDRIWFSEHAKQVTRMLPGGLDVIGVFSFCPTEALKHREPSIVQCIMEIFKLHNQSQNKPLFLHFCSRTKKIVTKLYDISSNQAKYKVVDFKFQKDLCSQFLKASCNYKFKLNIILNEKSNPKEEINNGIFQLSSSILQSKGVVDNQIYSESDDEIITCDKLPIKSKQNGIQVELLDSFSSMLFDSQTIGQCSGISILEGNIFSRAYIHSKEPITAIIAGLKQDIIRSIQSRFALLCEELDNQENPPFSSNKVQEIQWMLPRRIFFHWYDSITLCDYLLPTETYLDCQERLSELLSLTLPFETEKWFEEIEHFTDENKEKKKSSNISQQLSKNVELQKIEIKESVHTNPKTKSSSNSIFLISIFGVILSFIIWLILSK